MILVISSAQDLHTTTVMQSLIEEGAQATLLDLSQFPQQLQLSMRYNHAAGNEYRMLLDNTGLDLSRCGAVWWRRPQYFELHPDLTDSAVRSFAYNESDEAISGLWLLLDAFWVNHPIRNQEASRKAYQLKVAQEVGLDIPETLITNNPDEARAFVDVLGLNKTIYKAFSASERHWRETRLLQPEETAMLDNVKFAPVIFQEYIPAQVDLRVTMVKKNVFAAAIHSQKTSYKVDFRMDLHSAWIQSFDLPDEVVARLGDLMDRLGLVYGAIDMRLALDGRYVFLEINPAGQWLFIEQQTHQPITRTLAHALKHYDGQGNKRQE